MPRFHIFRISFILGVLLLNGKIRKHIKNPPGTYGGQFQGVQIFERQLYDDIPNKFKIYQTQLVSQSDHYQSYFNLWTILPKSVGITPGKEESGS